MVRCEYCRQLNDVKESLCCKFCGSPLPDPFYEAPRRMFAYRGDGIYSSRDGYWSMGQYDQIELMPTDFVQGLINWRP